MLSTEFYPLDKHNDCDSVWSLSTGPDRRIYIAACCEHTPGGVVKCMRFDSDNSKVDYLFDLSEQVNDPYNSGRATQCKIHYSFAPSPSDGVMYMATHLSGPPYDMPAYSPWASWNDPKRCFKGAAILAYDTNKDKTLWYDTLFPKEGCRCLAHDEKNGLLYAISYPRDHLFVYDLKKRSSRDLGRIGSVNSQCLFFDKQYRVWTVNDYGYFVRYSPDSDRLEFSPLQIPHHKNLQNGWHCVLYDAVASPDNECVYAVAWAAYPRLVRFWPNEGKWGRIEDLGQVNQQFEEYQPADYYTDHCGGLVFGMDQMLYMVGSKWDGYLDADPRKRVGKTEGIVWQYNPQTLERKQVAVLKQEGKICHYCSRGAMDGNGDLFFATVDVLNRPNAIFKVNMPENYGGNNSEIPLRMWG